MIFALRKLVIYKECGRKLKVLKPEEEYVFTDSKHDGFFGDGVVIHALVGKNGCGKSSLVELLFRMSNNFAALMLRGYERPAAEQIYFIKEVVADLHYSIDGANGMLKCRQDCVTLLLDNETFEWSLYSNECLHKKGGQQVTGETRFEKEVLAAKDFFYTIATNYSMQAYITNDFASEGLLAWSMKKKNWINTHDATSWIDGVFHKNDGYMSPIVLNPYRHEGIIDMAKEGVLTTNRLASILWETRSQSDKEQLIEGYRLLDIKYLFNSSTLIQKFDKKILKSVHEATFSQKFFHAYKQPNSIAKSILDAYGLTVNGNQNLLEKTLYIYLLYKTLRIAEKYPSYSHFKPLGNVNLVFQSLTEGYYHRLILELVAKIQNDDSHITLKIRQTLRLIEEIKKPHKKKLLKKHFTYKDYVQLFDLPSLVDSVEKRNELLPPPIFKPEIYLIKNEDYRHLKETVTSEQEYHTAVWKVAITLNTLSSGERQLIYIASTLVYHALNLKSVPERERVKYRQICIVLDEIEICFHPEYQRTFIQYFLGLIKRMKLTDSFGIDVLVVTHSPFVLSDIPQGNIMYLEEGHQLKREEMVARSIKNPFCANINDILNQSFFLTKGFVGEFAKQRVLSLAKYLSEKDNDDSWSREKAKAFIDEVGEPLVRDCLFNMFVERFGGDKENRIAFYQAEIKRLQQEKK